MSAARLSQGARPLQEGGRDATSGADLPIAISASRVRGWTGVALAIAGLCAGCSVPGHRSAPASDIGATAQLEIDTIASNALRERRIPGLALVVLKRGDVAFARGYGVGDIGRSESVSPATVFQLGSIGKPILAALVLRLADQQRLSLDDPVTRHLPEFGRLPADLRVRHLLSHTSGIREPFTMQAYLAGIEDLARRPEEMVAILRDAPVDFAPGARWSYSNANYMLLALIVERVTGRPYERVLATEVFEPMSLPSLRQCTPLPQLPAEARGHVGRRNQVSHAAPENMHWIRGDGGICGSALDLARWLRLLARGKLVSGAAFDRMRAPTQPDGGPSADYGLGLSLVSLDGVRRIGHNGAMLGFSASASHYPDSDLTVVVLANLGGVRTEAIERAAARRLLGMPAPDLRGQPGPADARERFTGSYDIGVFTVKVQERDGRLWLESPPPAPTTALRYLGGDEFAGDIDPDAIRIRFTTAGGRADALRLFMGGMHWYGRRLE